MGHIETTNLEAYLMDKYEGDVDDREALKAYLAEVMDFINYLKERYAV